MTPGPGIKPTTHWWEASAFTTVLFQPSQRILHAQSQRLARALQCNFAIHPLRKILLVSAKIYTSICCIWNQLCIQFFFQFETGVHRVQRVPLTETMGRVHTSTMTVAVLPQPTEVRDILYIFITSGEISIVRLLVFFHDYS